MVTTICACHGVQSYIYRALVSCGSRNKKSQYIAIAVRLAYNILVCQERQAYFFPVMLEVGELFLEVQYSHLIQRVY